MHEEKWYYVYILASQRNGTLYVGVTNVYYETFGDITAAIAREKRVKRWRRAWKIELIEKTNPTWKNLFDRETGHVAPLPGTLFQPSPPLSSRPSEA